jgi:EamA domain-containing membrane protein RarD
MTDWQMFALVLAILGVMHEVNLVGKKLDLLHTVQYDIRELMRKAMGIK